MFNKTTATFTYTPTAAQRVLAGLPGGTDPVQFEVTVSDGVKANNQIAPVTVPISPTQIGDVDEVSTGVNPGATWVAVTNTRAYVANYDAKTISVIDTINRAVVTTIDLGHAPISVAVTPGGKKIYVAEYTTNVITVIDGTTNQLLAPIDFGVNRYPVLLTISPDGKTLYVTNSLYNPKTDTQTAVVTKVSTTTNKITGTVKLPGALTEVFTRTIVSPDGKKIYAIADIPDETPGFVDSGLYVFSSTSSTAKLVITAGYLSAVAISPDNTRVYLADYNNGEVAVVDAKTNLITGFAAVGGNPIDLAVNGDGTLLMVFDAESTAVKVFDTRTPNYTLLTTVPTNATNIDFYPLAALSPDGMELYFTDDNGLQIISLVPANDPPVKGGPMVGAPNATTGVVTGDLNVDDPNHDVLTYTTTTAPGKGTVVINPDGTFTYTPTAAARHVAAVVGAPAATDTFVVTVSDGRRGIVTTEVIVDVLPANVDPTMKLSVPSPSSTTGIVKGSVTGTDKDKDALTYVGPIGPTAKGGTVVVDAKGKFTYTPSAQARHAAATVDPAAKIDTFTITVDDGHGGIVPVPVTVKISPTNTKLDGAAVALGEPNADGAVVGTVTANDADNDPFTITGPPSTRKGAITYEAAITRSPIPPPPLPASRRRHPTPARRSGPTPSPSPSTTDTAAPPSCPSNSPSPRSMATSPRHTQRHHGSDHRKGHRQGPRRKPAEHSGSFNTGKGAVTVQSSGTYTYTPTAAARHAASAVGALSDDVTTDGFVVTASDGRGAPWP